jgi:formylmethanofuran dehydrogenase subunit B
MSAKVYRDVVCSFCGSLCDDLVVEVEDNRIITAKNVCVVGRNRLIQSGADIPKLRVNGRDATQEEAYDEAARILTEAKAPLVYGLSSTTAEANREAVELAEILRASLDNPSSYCHGPGVLARQHVGLPTCTLGEVKNRADLILVWGANPMESHMRHFSRYSLHAKGLYAPEGRKNRKLVVIDVRPTPSSKNADVFLQVTPGSDFEIAAALRALARGLRLEGLTDDDLIGGQPIARWKELAGMIKACSYGVVLFGIGLTQSRGKDLNVEEVIRFVAEMNQYTRFNAIPMRGHANVNGSNQVFVWQTGFPLAINFSRGYPRFNPGEFSVVDLLNRGDVDACLIVATDPGAHLTHGNVEALKKIPTILLEPTQTMTTPWANVVIPVAPAGIGVEGTYYRMDNVPLRLRKILYSPYPSDEEVLHAIKERVKHAKNSKRKSL